MTIAKEMKHARICKEILPKTYESRFIFEDWFVGLFVDVVFRDFSRWDGWEWDIFLKIFISLQQEYSPVKWECSCSSNTTLYLNDKDTNLNVNKKSTQLVWFWCPPVKNANNKQITSKKTTPHAGFLT